jgi:antitoxin (DNA-binding transcriptional repressor) of toxin-antitoxin stability system
MHSVNIAEFKAKMGKFLRLVRSGVEVILLDRNHPIAKVTPFSKEQETKVSVRKPIQDPKELRNLSFTPRKGRRTDSVSFLLEDRKSR